MNASEMETASGLKTNRMGNSSLKEFLNRNSHQSIKSYCVKYWISYYCVFSSLFTDEEIQLIRNVTFHDVLVAVTSAEATEIQKNVFFWKDGKNVSLIFKSQTCNNM